MLSTSPSPRYLNAEVEEPLIGAGGMFGAKCLDQLALESVAWRSIQNRHSRRDCLRSICLAPSVRAARQPLRGI